MKKNFRQIIITTILGLIFIGGIILAGQLTPTGTPGTSFVTLTDIYEKILDNTYATSSRDYEPGSGPAVTHYTLDEIFNAIPTINPDIIISGNSILGVDGTYETSNLTPDKVASGTVYGVGLVGTWEPPEPYYLLEGFGGANTDGSYFDSGLTQNGRKVFVNENNVKCLVYFDTAAVPPSPPFFAGNVSAGWATANCSLPSMIGGPRYANPQGSLNPEDLPWRQFITGDEIVCPLPVGTITKVGEPNP